MDWLEAFTKDALTFYAVEFTEGERVGGSEWEWCVKCRQMHIKIGSREPSSRFWNKPREGKAGLLGITESKKETRNKCIQCRCRENELGAYYFPFIKQMTNVEHSYQFMSDVSIDESFRIINFFVIYLENNLNILFCRGFISQYNKLFLLIIYIYIASLIYNSCLFKLVLIIVYYLYITVLF